MVSADDKQHATQQLVAPVNSRSSLPPHTDRERRKYVSSTQRGRTQKEERMRVAAELSSKQVA